MDIITPSLIIGAGFCRILISQLWGFDNDSTQKAVDGESEQDGSVVIRFLLSLITHQIFIRCHVHVLVPGQADTDTRQSCLLFWVSMFCSNIWPQLNLTIIKCKVVVAINHIISIFSREATLELALFITLREGFIRKRKKKFRIF